MRRDKGFFFLLDALEELPEAAARRVHLVIAARCGPPEAMARVEALSDRFASVRHADGYSHATLDALLAEVDVGVVPVLWEDNLPQVAIEMHARHIPLITSDLGGARELGATEQMVFRAGSAASFRDVLLELLAERVDLDAYWRRARAPMSMAEHAAGLRALYAELTGATRPAPAETAAEAAGAADAAAGPHPAQTFEEPGAMRLDRGRHA
jgi:glycosyltransferase involved in cell wall biosynthesis